MRVVLKPLGLIIVLAGLLAAIVVPMFQLRSLQNALAKVKEAANKPTPTPTPRPNFIPVGLKNLKMSDMEGTLPADWNLAWTGRGKAYATRDTGVYHSEPASLCMIAEDGEGQIGQSVDAQPGATWTVKGYLKSEGEATILFGVQAYKDWTPITMLKVAGLQGVKDWTPFQQTVTLPREANRAAVVLYVNGKGRAWLDDVEASRSPQAPAVAAKAAP